VTVVSVVDSTGRYTAVVVCAAGQDRRVFSVTGSLGEISDVTVRCPTLEPLDETVQGNVTGFSFSDAIKVAYGRESGEAQGSATRSYSVAAQADAHHDVVAVVSDASFRLNRLVMVRDVAAGAIAADTDIDLAVDGFAPLEHELTVLTGAANSVATEAHFFSALGTVIDVNRYDFSSSPGWYALPAAALTATEVHLLEAREETFPGQRGGTVVRQAAGDVTIDVRTTAALPETTLAAVDDTVSMATDAFPVGVLEGVLSTFDSVTSTQTRHTVVVTPARASSSVTFPSSATVPGFDAVWNLGVQPSGTVRVHQGAAPAAIVDVLVDGPLGHDGVAFTFGGTRLGS
jgi:flagellar hook-basal body complex protein FliE